METKEPNPNPQVDAKSPGRTISVVGALALGTLLVGGIMPRLQQSKNLAEDTKDINGSVREVNVVSPHLQIADALQLPSNIRALEETLIYARTSGYLTRRYVDIGSRVLKGQVLAEVQSPDVDQQAFQARADQAKAVATVGQSEADVQNKQAGVQEMEAQVARARAGIEQARALLAGSISRLSQTKSALAAASAKVAQTRQALAVQRASLKQTEAQRDLAETTAKRYRSMLQQGFVAQQDADQAEATLKTTSAAVESSRASIGAAQADVDAALQDVESGKAVVSTAEADVRSSRENVSAAQAAYTSAVANVSAAKANVGASRANVVASVAQVRSNQANTERFSVLQGFSKIVAPFDGVITLRNADVGSLVTPGDSTNTKLALFSMARVDTLRIQVGVPQTYFQSVKPGTKVTILVRELPGRKFEGSVFQNAGAIDPATRTMLTEVRVKNLGNLMVPGMYARVQFAVDGTAQAIRIPSNTLTIDASGTRVDVVGPDNKLRFVPIKLGRDFGTEVEVTSGLAGNEKLVSNPTDDLKDGQEVKILASKEAK
ncbi:MAG: efflux RND transporter periplasmic adaptor subunit [Fimbriimonas sp.]|nr:efflux RND transporter periplasmic adaptor subunit [Fimbriimonas sp.]